MRLKRDRRAERRAETTELAARAGAELAAALRGVTVRHEVNHLIEHKPRPKPTHVYAEISNGSGEIWRLPGFNLGPDQRYVSLQGVPIAFITGRAEDAPLGQAGIKLILDY